MRRFLPICCEDHTFEVAAPLLNLCACLPILLFGGKGDRMSVDVLIVDDSAAIRKILQRMLGQTGVTLGKVVEAGDGVEALERLKVQPVNLILSDINMPNMDGIQLLTELKAKAESKHIPVIMIT